MAAIRSSVSVRSGSTVSAPAPVSSAMSCQPVGTAMERVLLSQAAFTSFGVLNPLNIPLFPPVS
jgi:hypothetical protein